MSAYVLLKLEDKKIHFFYIHRDRMILPFRTRPSALTSNCAIRVHRSTVVALSPVIIISESISRNEDVDTAA